MGILNLITTLGYTSDYARSYSSYDIDDLMSGASSSSVAEAGVWVLISAILALVGGLLAYFLFVKKKGTNPANKFLAWLKSYLKFDRMFIEDILKMVYIVLALFITLSSFACIGTSFLTFLLTITLGNLALRIGFELTMITIMIWRNTTDIKAGICKGEEKSEKKK